MKAGSAPSKPAAALTPRFARTSPPICWPWKILPRNIAPELLLIESGGDNLAAHFSRELADYSIYVIDVAGGDKIPRKGGPGITQSDLLVINKTDLADAVGADLGVMDRDARAMRGSGPFIFAQVKNLIGVDLIATHIATAANGQARLRHGQNRRNRFATNAPQSS